LNAEPKKESEKTVFFVQSCKSWKFATLPN